METKKILVTGASGFIGSYLVAELKKQGHDVVGIDSKDCDITDEKGVNDLFKKEKFDIVFHLAGFISHNNEDAKRLFLVNTFGTFNILKASVAHKVKKMIYSSSTSVYNRQKIMKLPIKEYYELPENIYGASKLAGENLCELFRQNYRLPVVSLRYSSVYGFGQNRGAVLDLFVQSALDGQDIKVFDEGKRTQDFVYVKDVVEANMKAAFLDAEGIFNIGSGKETSMMELAKTVLAVFREGKSKIIKEKSENPDKTRLLLDITRAKKILKYKPEYSLKKGLEEYKNETRNHI